ncbi:MAG: DNA polymerase III subunit gamma/tau [Gammaproteobacteria bacterium]|nr:DNA polymerase III subunit gamma/tau [Gammaproteobacteria bacterium]
MSYQVLARKWRPSNFKQVAGQSHVLKSLINALDNQRLHHAYLFTGTRGVGKTTLARILAKCLNCEEGISSIPCEKCTACLEISEGRFIDLIEVDAASRTKVEDTRELLENVQYSPSRGRFKVYLIDEVHMLSKHSFNALLKTLEEPPPHVKFLLATTDPQKLPITILSRCLQFNLKNLSPKGIVEYLQHVLNEEGIVYDEEALWQIAAAASGSMRDALTLVDQAISYCQGKIDKSGVVDMLGVPDQQQVFSLLSAMASGDVSRLLALVNSLSDRSPDYAHTLDNMLTCLHRLAIAQVAPASVDNSYGDKAQMEKLAKLFTAEDIQLFYQIGVNGRADLRSGIDIRTAFEMLLIRMMVFSPTLIDEEMKPALPQPENDAAVAENTDEVKKKPEELNQASQTNDIESNVDNGAEAENLATRDKTSDIRKETAAQVKSSKVDQETTEKLNSKVPQDDRSKVAQPSVQSVEGYAETGLTDELEDAKSDAADGEGSELIKKKPDESAKADANPKLEKHSPDSDTSSLPDGFGKLDHESWLNIYSTHTGSGNVANILDNCQLLVANEDKILFRLDSELSGVYNEEYLPRLEAVIAKLFGKSLRVVVEIGKVDVETPARLAAKKRKESREELVQRFEQDSNVQELIKRFSATIAIDSIVPVDKKV